MPPISRHNFTLSNDYILSLLSKIEALIKNAQSSKRFRASAFIIAILIFFGGLALCIGSSPDIFSKINYGPFLILLLVGVPLTLVFNALDFVYSAELVERRFAFLEAFKISIFSTAANMLPLPGGAVIRVAALRQAGAGLGEGTRVTLATGFIWLGVSLIFSSAWIAAYMPSLAVLSGLGGSLVFIMGVIVANSKFQKNIVILKIISLKLAATLLVAFKLMLSLYALGQIVPFSKAAVMSAADVIGSAVMIVPAGLGVNEAVSAVLAQAVGLTAATGFLAAVINRLSVLIAICPVTIYLYFKKPA